MLLLRILGLQKRGNSLNVPKFATNAVKLWKSEFSGTYSSPHKRVELSRQKHHPCTRHNKPITYLEKRCITFVTAVAPRVLQSTLLTLLQLIGLPVLVGGCSTRSRYDQKKLSQSHRFVELYDCPEAYWGYCRNGGICKMTTDISQRTVPICSCPTGFRGRQCELINDPNIYFSRQQGQMQMAAMSGVVVAIIYMKYGIEESNSFDTFDTLELSPSINSQRQDPRSIITEKNEIVEVEAEHPSMHKHLVEKVNHPSTVFEMFTLTEYPNKEYIHSHSMANMATKNRNVPRRARPSIIVLPEI
uniref:EGF-like domain-containing protein n=1 Tax=Setaria digitata TaxID=48799 RepID=A0A915PN24_9BILA